MSDEVVLGFDVGRRRIGVALGNRITDNARALTHVVGGDPPDWPAIDALVADWRPQHLVVGLPLTESGAPQPIEACARHFMRELEARFALPVTAVDERFSTIEAADRLRAARAAGHKTRRVAKGDTDAVAAAVIVETWLADRNVGERP